MNVQISFAAPDVPTLCEAIQAVRALGIAPAVAIAPAPAAPARRGAPEPEVETYLEARGETTFRRTKEEKRAGLSRNEAARLRMAGDNWKGEEMANDGPDESEPWDGGDTFGG